MTEYEIYKARASFFWQKFGNELLLRLIDAGLPICEYRCFPSGQPSNIIQQREMDKIGPRIVFEQLKYEKRKKKRVIIRTKWLSKPFPYQENRKTLSRRILIIYPVHVRAKGKKSYGQPKDLVYAYLIFVKERDNEHDWSSHSYFIETLWNGMPLRKSNLKGKVRDHFPIILFCPGPSL